MPKDIHVLVLDGDKEMNKWIVEQIRYAVHSNTVDEIFHTFIHPRDNYADGVSHMKIMERKRLYNHLVIVEANLPLCSEDKGKSPQMGFPILEMNENLRADGRRYAGAVVFTADIVGLEISAEKGITHYSKRNHSDALFRHIYEYFRCLKEGAYQPKVLQ